VNIDNKFNKNDILIIFFAFFCVYFLFILFSAGYQYIFVRLILTDIRITL